MKASTVIKLKMSDVAPDSNEKSDEAHDSTAESAYLHEPRKPLKRRAQLVREVLPEEEVSP
jgi:hypothetical protein